MADYSATKALTLVTRKDIGSLQIREFPVPELAPHEVLIENVAVAQNMGDWKRIVFDAVPEVPWTIGSDVAGTVVRVGSAVTKIKAGDRVLAYVARFPGTARHGGYQTLTVAEEGLAAHLPPHYTYEQGATIPQGFVTVACGLIEGLKQSLDINAPAKGEPLLVWGGSSSCGAYAVQLAKHAGYTVLATASPAHHDYVRSLGALHVFDYHSPDVVSQIHAVAGPGLSLVLDMIGTVETIEDSADSITAPGGGTIASVLIMPSPSGELVVAPEETTAKLAARGIKLTPAWAWHIDQAPVRERTFDVLKQFLESGKLIPNRVKVMPGGLNSVPEGLRLAQAGKISGEKLVYRVADTIF